MSNFEKLVSHLLIGHRSNGSILLINNVNSSEVEKISRVPLARHEQQVSTYIVQSLNSPFFPPSIEAEPGRAKRESLISPARVQSLKGAGRN